MSEPLTSEQLHPVQRRNITTTPLSTPYPHPDTVFLTIAQFQWHYL